MLTYIKTAIQKHKDRRWIVHAADLLKQFYPHINPSTRIGAVQSVWNLIAEYNVKYGDSDGFADRYFAEVGELTRTQGFY